MITTNRNWVKCYVMFQKKKTTKPELINAAAVFTHNPDPKS